MNKEKEYFNIFHQFIGIFIYPTKIFEDLTLKPRWFYFFLLIAVISIILNLTIWYVPKSENALKEKIYEKTKQIKEEGKEVPDDFIEKQIKYAKIFAPIMAPISLLILTLLISGIVYFISFLFLNGKANFLLNFIIVLYTMAVYMLYGVIESLVLLIKGKADFTTSLIIFFPSLDETSKIYYFVENFELFYLWQAILIGLGLKIINKWKDNRGIVLALSLFIIWVIITGLIKL